MDEKQKALTRTKGGGAMVRFNPYTEEAAQEEQKALDEDSSGVFMKLKPGKNVIRILPPTGQNTSPFVVFHQHFIEVPGADGPVSFACPRLAKVGPCPACAKAEALLRSGNPRDAEFGRQLQPRRRVLCDALDRTVPEKGAQILAFGKQIHEQLVALRREPDAGGDYTDPVNGFDIIIERTGTGREDTKYKVFPARRTSPLGDLSVLEGAHDLLQYTAPKSHAEILAVLGGTATAASGGRVAMPRQGAQRQPTAQTMIETEDGGDGDENPFEP